MSASIRVLLLFVAGKLLGTVGQGDPYMDLSSRYRLISGSDVMTSAAMPAVTTALISFMPGPPFERLCPLSEPQLGLLLPTRKAPSPGCCGPGGRCRRGAARRARRQLPPWR